MDDKECVKFQCTLRAQCGSKNCAECNKRYNCDNCVHSVECDIIMKYVQQRRCTST